MTTVFWPRTNNLKPKLPDKNYLNYICGTGSKISPSALQENHEEKDFPET